MLPQVSQQQLNVRPINWGTLPRRYFHPGELEVLIALAKSIAPTRVAEFGCNEGRTSRALIDNVPSIECMIGVDVLPGYVTVCEVQRREIPVQPGHYALESSKFELLLRKNGTLDLMPSDLGTLDMVFIDGDHSRIVVEHDTQLARACVKPGGLIVWHDYHALQTVQVRDVLDEQYRSGRDIHHVQGTWLAFERV